MDPSAVGRPLDNAELRELRRIERCLRRSDPALEQRLRASPAGRARPTGGASLRWTHVVGVMAGVCAFVAATTALPEQVMLVVLTVTMLVVVPAGCLVWAAVHGEL